jgi:hypothetical protein
MTSKESVSIACNIPGWMRPAELAWLHWAASRIPEGGTWIEIGSWKGRSLVATALGLPKDCRLISVENFAGNAGSKVQGDLALPVPWVEWQLELAVRMIRRLRPDLSVVCFPYPSVSAAGMMREDDKAHAIFIDGEHSYAAAKQDILAWRPHLRAGGLLCGHDREHKGVRQALAETVPDFSKAPGSIWWRVEPAMNGDAK